MSREYGLMMRPATEQQPAAAVFSWLPNNTCGPICTADGDDVCLRFFEETGVKVKAHETIYTSPEAVCLRLVPHELDYAEVASILEDPGGKIKKTTTRHRFCTEAEFRLKFYLQQSDEQEPALSISKPIWIADPRQEIEDILWTAYSLLRPPVKVIPLEQRRLIHCDSRSIFMVEKFNLLQFERLEG